MDTQAERRNEVIGVAKDFLGAKTAGEFAGAVADKMAEGGQKMFMQGIKRIINSKVFKWSAVVLHFIVFVIGAAAVGVGASSAFIGSPPPLLNCMLNDLGVVETLSVSLFLLVNGAMLLILAFIVGLIWCCTKCCGCKAVCGTVLFVLALTEILGWLGYTFYYLPGTFVDWLDDRDSCSDLIMIFTVSVTVSTLIVAGVYVGIIVIGISYGLYLKYCTHQDREQEV